MTLDHTTWDVCLLSDDPTGQTNTTRTAAYEDNDEQDDVVSVFFERQYCLCKTLVCDVCCRHEMPGLAMDVIPWPHELVRPDPPHQLVRSDPPHQLVGLAIPALHLANASRSALVFLFHFAKENSVTSVQGFCV